MKYEIKNNKKYIAVAIDNTNALVCFASKKHIKCFVHENFVKAIKTDKSRELTDNPNYVAKKAGEHYAVYTFVADAKELKTLAAAIAKAYTPATPAPKKTEDKKSAPKKKPATKKANVTISPEVQAKMNASKVPEVAKK